MSFLRIVKPCVWRSKVSEGFTVPKVVSERKRFRISEKFFFSEVFLQFFCVPYPTWFNLCLKIRRFRLKLRKTRYCKPFEVWYTMQSFPITFSLKKKQGIWKILYLETPNSNIMYPVTGASNCSQTSLKVVSFWCTFGIKKWNKMHFYHWFPTLRTAQFIFRACAPPQNGSINCRLNVFNVPTGLMVCGIFITFWWNLSFKKSSQKTSSQKYFHLFVKTVHHRL